MKLLALFCLVLQTASYIQGLSTKGCRLSLNEDLSTKNEPLFLRDDKDEGMVLMKPKAEGKNGYLEIATGQEVILACPGKSNHLLASKEEVTRAKCISNNVLSVKGKYHKSGTLGCKSRTSSDVIRTEQTCANGQGTILELGFKVDDAWVKLIEVCHDIEGAKTFYATHTVPGTIEGKVMRSTGRPAFTRGERWLYKGFDPNTAFKVSHQEKVLTTLLGKKKASEYINQKQTKFMARGHLAPDADFLFSPHQFLTYFYVNAAPQWQSINAGNWLRTETNTRNIASKLGQDLQVVTGTYGVSEMTDDKGKEVEIWLEGNDRLPVPELYWKAIRNPEDDSCIAIVATNNPFLKQAPKTICTDICEKNNWPLYQDDLFKGYVYCCKYEDLKKKISYAPDLNCKSVLKFKK